MSGGFVLTPRARDDLDGIWDFTVEHWDVDQADRYLYSPARSGFREPGRRDRSGRSAETIRPGYHRLTGGAHIVFYRTGDAGRIEVIRIRHERMDAERHL